MKKIYMKPAATAVKVAGSTALMSLSDAKLHGSIEGEEPVSDFGIHITWAGSSKNDQGEKDGEGRLWAD